MLFFGVDGLLPVSEAFEFGFELFNFIIDDDEVVLGVFELNTEEI